MKDVEHIKLNAWDSARYAIDAERHRQDRKWGVQDHDHFTWLAILMEEMGETSQAMLKFFDLADRPKDVPLDELIAHIEEELTQTAAVAVAWLENIHRRKMEQEKRNNG